MSIYDAGELLEVPNRPNRVPLYKRPGQLDLMIIDVLSKALQTGDHEGYMTGAPCRKDASYASMGKDYVSFLEAYEHFSEARVCERSGGGARRGRGTILHYKLIGR